MLMPTLIMGGLALVCLALAYYRDTGQNLAGLRSASIMTIEILPLLFCALVVAEMVQILHRLMYLIMDHRAKTD